MMNKTIKFLSAGLLLIVIAACVGSRVEQFSESFFTYENEEGKKYFSFILKLKGVKSRESDRYEPIITNQKTGQRSKSRQRNEQILRPENPEDARVSLKFRMEEKAHEMLLAKLQASDYCGDDVEYESETFEFYQYKIKGFCVE